MSAGLVAIASDLMARRPISVHLTAPLVEVLSAHGLAGRVSACSPAGEPEALHRLGEHARATALLSMQGASTTGRVASAALQARIDLLTYKGVALSSQLGEALTERLTTDVDVLVPRSAVAAMSDIVVGLGYQPRVRYRWGPRGLEDRLHIERTFDGPGPSVDLHWAVTWPSTLTVTFEELWRRRQAVLVEGVRVWTLDSVDALLVTAVHGTRSGWAQWKWLVDAGRQVRGLSMRDLGTARARAERFGCERALAVTLSMVQRVGALSLPAAVTPSAGLRDLAVEAIEATALRPGVNRHAVGAAVRRQRWRWRTADSPGRAAPVLTAAAGREVLRRGVGEVGRSLSGAHSAVRS